MRILPIVVAVLALVAVGCASSGDRTTDEETSYSFRPADHRPRVQVASSEVVTEPATEPTRTSVDLPVASPAPRPAPAAEAVTWVRLRGSNEIHVSTCEKVHRASPDGVVSAHREDGPPCFYCMREDALLRDR